MTKAGNMNLVWDKNGWLVAKQTIPFEYNWDGKLRSAAIEGKTVSIKYDPAGNRVQKNSFVNGNRKYIIDISGELPTILMEINTANGDIMKTYIYANSQILAQHDGDSSDPRYFYLHDRLGSVRLLLNSAGSAVNSYTYNPFGEMFPTECAENISNPFKFAGQYYDSEIGQYYLRARQYDPALMRFTGRDPVGGNYQEPMTLHKYLYCINNPVNQTDPTGQSGLNFLINTVYGLNTYYTSLDAGLKAAGGDPWAIMDVAIGVNKWRENWFQMDNLTTNTDIRQMLIARGEGIMYRGIYSLINAQYQAMLAVANACDWGALGGCVLPEVDKFLAMSLIEKYSGLDAAGVAACTACVIEPTKITCIPCIAYIAYEAWGYTEFAYNITGCIKNYCGH